MTMNRRMLIPFALVASLFMLWGIANNMNDTLLAAFKRIMSMSDLQTSLVQFAFYGAYFCVAFPTAIYIQRNSYKKGIVLGLMLYALGTMLFYPAGEAGSYGFYLFAIYIMACGCAVLETTANPYILSMGGKETATRRLNFAQTLNPIGAIIGILLSRHFILSELHSADALERANMGAVELAQVQQHELSAVSGAYLIVGCVLLVLMVIILAVKMPEGKDIAASVSLRPALSRLWHNKPYRYGVVAQFFYVGVQTCVWSFTIRLSMSQLDILEKDASMIFLCSIIGFTLFRFFFTWVMGYIKPIRLLSGASCVAFALTVTVMFTSGWTSIIALVAISACMSLMFPTIYGVSLNKVSADDAKIAASGLIMAILGGALITPAQAYFSDRYGISCSFIVPAFCFMIICLYSGYIFHKDHAR